MFIKDHSRASGSYLVICDGISQLLDEPGQRFGIIDVAEEPNKCMLVGERFKLGNNSLELPDRGISKQVYIHMSTNLRSSTLLPFSA